MDFYSTTSYLVVGCVVSGFVACATWALYKLYMRIRPHRPHEEEADVPLPRLEKEKLYLHPNPIHSIEESLHLHLQYRPNRSLYRFHRGVNFRVTWH